MVLNNFFRALFQLSRELSVVERVDDNNVTDDVFLTICDETKIYGPPGQSNITAEDSWRVDEKWKAGMYGDRREI